MFFSDVPTISLIDGLAAAGLLQAVMILVYISFRVRVWRQAGVAFAYFLFLALFFALQFALPRFDDFSGEIRFALWLSAAMGRPLCYLLVLQVVRLIDLPDARHFWILVLVPAAVGVSYALTSAFSLCADFPLLSCARFFDTLYWSGAMAGALCMLAIWAHRNVFGGLQKIKGGRERFWLVITLVAANVLSVAVGLFRTMGDVTTADADGLLVIFSLAFCYLATTTLFRVYPPPVALSVMPSLTFQHLSDSEREIAGKVRQLMDVDKVYQEPAFSRAHLAKEAGTSESILSRVVNVSFGKSVPQMLNEYRLEDAKVLLRNPVIPVQKVAFESGFNSLASFNRVFRDLTGETPSSWREKHGQKN